LYLNTFAIPFELSIEDQSDLANELKPSGMQTQ